MINSHGDHVCLAHQMYHSAQATDKHMKLQPKACRAVAFTQWSTWSPKRRRQGMPVLHYGAQFLGLGAPRTKCLVFQGDGLKAGTVDSGLCEFPWLLYANEKQPTMCSISGV